MPNPNRKRGLLVLMLITVLAAMILATVEKGEDSPDWRQSVEEGFMKTLDVFENRSEGNTLADLFDLSKLTIEDRSFKSFGVLLLLSACTAMILTILTTNR